MTLPWPSSEQKRQKNSKPFFELKNPKHEKKQQKHGIKTEKKTEKHVEWKKTSRN